MQRNAEEAAKGCAASDFDELLICLTNNLATLVAAIVILS
jgi:threonine aldolase